MHLADDDDPRPHDLGSVQINFSRCTGCGVVHSCNRCDRAMIFCEGMVSQQSYYPTWRESPFEIGKRYRTLKSAPALPVETSLVPGELVSYEQSSYSRYDSCSIYHFKTDSGEERTWLLSDDAPLESWDEVFEPET